MATYLAMKTLALLALAIFLSVQGTLGGISCENLDKSSCAFAVSSTGQRCVLEKYVKRSGRETYTCRTSGIEADDKINNWVETDQCIKDCGVDRKSLGISSDALIDSSFTQKLCSPQCYKSCPNIVDLYFNLAAGEGVFLPKLCESQRKDGRQEMSKLRSSGIVAAGPIHSVTYADAPAMSPSYFF